MSDTIKINREMLREAFNEAKNRNSSERVLECLELRIFGPKKLREAWAYIGAHKGEIIKWRSKCDSPPTDPIELNDGVWVRFREVIE